MIHTFTDVVRDDPLMELIKLYPDDLSFYEESCYWRILMRLGINDKWKTILKRNTPEGQY